MTSRNYRRGYDAEKRLLDMLLQAGWWAERAHASKGTFDIIASRDTQVLFIQVKRSKRNVVSLKAIARQYREDLARMQAIRTPPSVSIELWQYTDPLPGSRTGTWRRFRVFGGHLVKVDIPEAISTDQGGRG